MTDAALLKGIHVVPDWQQKLEGRPAALQAVRPDAPHEFESLVKRSVACAALRLADSASKGESDSDSK